MATIFHPVSYYCNVHIVSTEVVLPASPTQQHILPLSNLDLTIPPLSVHVFFCYKNSSDRTFESLLSHLKISLSRALVRYYVFAGRLTTNTGGLPELVCNNKGARVTYAYATTVLAELNLYDPDETARGKLVPLLLKASDENGLPVFAVQVTEFSCGGMVVGYTFHHSIADAFSANMFFTYWANLSSNMCSNVSQSPSFSRSILCPRDPPTYCAEIFNMYVKQPSGESGEEIPRPPLDSRIYYVHAESIINLQISANRDGNNYSKLVAFSAYLWKLLVNAEEVEDIKKCRMGIAVDGRSRLGNIGITNNFFGNVILTPFAECNAVDLKNKSLSWSAELIHNAIYCAANEEHFQSLIDLVEKEKPTFVLPKICCKADDVHAVVVSSGLRFSLYEVDHGWGKPAFASYHIPFDSETGYILPTRSPVGDGSWVVYIRMPRQQLNAVETQPNCILSPVTQDLLASS